MARAATGQVVERKGARGVTYALRFRAYGNREYVTLGSAADGWTRRKAEEELTNVLADVRRGLWQRDRPQRVEAPSRVPTFHEFASEWFANHRLEVGERTSQNYEWALTQHLLPFFKDHPVDEITIAEVDRYRTSKIREREAGHVERPLSNRTINDTISRLAQVLEVAVEYGYLPANPAKGRRRRCKAPSPRRAWLEPEQIEALVQGAVRGLRGGKTVPDDRTRALLSTAICAGLRIGELLALQWRDVDLANGRIVVRASKTEAGERTVDLWPELQDELATHKARQRSPSPTSLVFGTSSGKPDTRQNVRKRLGRAVERANETLSAEGLTPIADGLTNHSLRRTFASLLYLRGADPVYVMEQMGHTDPKMALGVYTKVIGDRTRRGTGERLTGVLRGVEWARMGTNDDPGLTSSLPLVASGR